jgi:hypothetical protein
MQLMEQKYLMEESMSEEQRMEAQRWLDEYNGLNDKQKLKRLSSCGADYTMWLDNDCTWVTLDIDSEDSEYQLEFDNFLGRTPLVETLLSLYGIKAEVC